VVIAKQLVVVGSQPSVIAFLMGQLIPMKGSFKLVAALEGVISKTIHMERALSIFID
jgi:hypothetical protein